MLVFFNTRGLTIHVVIRIVKKDAFIYCLEKNCVVFEKHKYFFLGKFVMLSGC
jgi:hypothetical protein